MLSMRGKESSVVEKVSGWVEGDSVSNEYSGGYKYQLRRDIKVRVSIRQPRDIVTRFIKLTPDGYLTVRLGYASDGPSGPTVDTKTIMRGAFVHDALYQLIRCRDIVQEWRL